MRRARKARLFVCACARHSLGRPTPRQIAALEAAEAFADGLCPAERMRSVHTDVDSTFWATCADMGTCRRAVEAALYCGCFLPGAARVRCVRRVRCVFGDPFRPVAVDPAWLTPDVAALARAAYDERPLPSGELDQARLAVLADALEEAGALGELVAHLRGPGPHIRGCHVVELCLGLG